MRKLSALLVLSVLVLGCGDSGSAAPGTATPDSPASTSTVLKKLRLHPMAKLAHSASSAAPMKVDKPVGGEVAAAAYPEAGIQAIDASCKAPWVTVALDEKGAARDGAVVEQALAANPAFKVVAADPRDAGAILVELRANVPAGGAPAPASSGAPAASAAPKASAAAAPSGGGSFVVARCHDAGTCTRFAAMIKAVAKWSPTTGCGDLEAKVVAAPKGRVLAATPAKAGDVDALCARLGACKLASEPASTDDPVGACQRSASSFKTDCALKTSCDEVLKCQQ